MWASCLVGIGVSFEVTADVVTMAGEGVALALCKVFGLKFAAAKVGVDCSLVVIALVFSFGFTTRWLASGGHHCRGIFVGMTARQVNKPMGHVGELLLS